MGGLDELLRLGAPWWVVGLFLIAVVAVAAKGLVALLTSTAGATATQTGAGSAGTDTAKQKIEINIRTGADDPLRKSASEDNRGTDNPFDRVHRSHPPVDKSTLAEELELLKGPKDEVSVNVLPAEKS